MRKLRNVKRKETASARPSYLPMTGEEEKTAGITAEHGSKRYYAQWAYLLFAESEDFKEVKSKAPEDEILNGIEELLTENVFAYWLVKVVISLSKKEQIVTAKHKKKKKRATK